jgi:pyruvate dehydrogenase E1 component alpha subunit
MGTALALAQSQTDLCAKARSYELRVARVDGMNVEAVEQTIRTAVTAVRSGSGPWFIECQTYRFRAHSMFDAELYRDKREVQLWKQRDPIAALSGLLTWSGALSESDLARMESEVAMEIDRAVAFAEAGHLEPVEELTRDVYAEEAPDGA